MKERKMYNYRVYGMNVESEIILSELLTSNSKEGEAIDVNISYGRMPKEVLQEIEKGKYYNFEKDKVWFYIPNVANYYIYDGRFIVVEPDNNCSKEDIKIFLLGSAFGILLIQRNIIAIHGGTILLEGQAMIFTGDMGAGKSTLTSAFRQKGYPFMSDDVSVTGKGKDEITMVYPGYPQQKLCGDAIKKMGYDAEAFKRVDEGRDKYAIPVHKSFVKEPMPMGALFEIAIGDGTHVEIEEIIGTEKIKLLLKNIYRVEVTQYSGMSSVYFKNCIEIVKRVPFFKIKRPKDKFSVEEQISVIEKTLKYRDKKVI